MPALSARHAFHQFFLLPAAVLAGLFCYHHHCFAIMTSLEPVEITLEPVFRVTCPVEPAHNVGDSGEGVRKIVPIAPGGTITSPIAALDGAVGMHGGSDYFRTDQFGKTRLDARYFFKLKSGRKFFPLSPHSIICRKTN
jgi:hypothetical protein